MLTPAIKVEKSFSLSFSEDKGYEVTDGSDFTIRKSTPNIRLKIAQENTALLALLNPAGFNNTDVLMRIGVQDLVIKQSMLKYLVIKAPTRWYNENGGIDFDNILEDEFEIVFQEVEKFNTPFRPRTDPGHSV